MCRLFLSLQSLLHLKLKSFCKSLDKFSLNVIKLEMIGIFDKFLGFLFCREKDCLVEGKKMGEVV